VQAGGFSNPGAQTVLTLWTKY